MSNLEKSKPEYIIFYLKGYGNPIPGAESAGFNILKSIANKLDYRIIIISDQKAKKKKDEILYKHKNLSINIPILNFVINNFFASRMINYLSKKYNPKIIHVQGYAGYYPIVSFNSKTILTLHDDPSMKIFDKDRNDPRNILNFFGLNLVGWQFLKLLKNMIFFKLGLQGLRII